MNGDLVTYLVVGIGALVSLVTVVGLIFVPVVRMYPTWWQRSAAGVLALVVVWAFAIGGIYVGLQFVDRFLS
ncbi:hypothetical protein [Patulibacter minatonensis]|uniref:hypothetical protein n=1 Tax=Patulibacter minatonensis TaxID=298163 RepID=UPI0004792EE5|nr:hypothetical protein [Patulibacter minatonensis]